MPRYLLIKLLPDTIFHMNRRFNENHSVGQIFEVSKKENSIGYYCKGLKTLLTTELEECFKKLPDIS